MSRDSWVAPPNWPAPPPLWTRGPGWNPDPAWGPAPAGWIFWPGDARRSRILAALDVALVVAFSCIYLLIIHSQGNKPAYWFLTFLTAAAICALITVVRGTPTPLVANVTILGVCAVLGLFSIGVLLLPAAGAGIASYLLASRSRQP